MNDAGPEPNRASKTRGRQFAETNRNRSNLTLRIREVTKQALERRAAQNGRSLSEETEWLIEQSLKANSVLDEALELSFGRKTAGVALLLARLIRDTETMTSVSLWEESLARLGKGTPSTRVLVGQLKGTSAREGSLGEQRKGLLDDAVVFDQVPQAIALAMSAMRPLEGDRRIRYEVRPVEADRGNSKAPSWPVAKLVTLHVLNLIASADKGEREGDWALTVRRKLGRDVVQRIERFIAEYGR